MTITDKSVARVQIVLLVALLVAVWRASWCLAEISTKVDALWADRHQRVAATASHRDQP